MPRFDGTGPEGKGPRTGRGLGNCPKEKDQEKTSSVMSRNGRGQQNGSSRRGRGRNRV